MKHRHLLVALTLFTAVAAPPAVAASEPDLEIELGFGYDSNPFLSPEASYFDQNFGEVVDPQRAPGPFVPLRLRGRYPVALGEDRRFVTDLSVDADTYADSGSENADEFFLKLAPGLDWKWDGEGPKERALWVAPLLIYNQETYFDRDTGASRISGGEDVSNRYTYTAYGAELEYELQPSRAFEYKLRARVEDRDYERVPVTLSLDHLYYWVGLDAEIDFPGPTKLYLDYRFRVRDYDTRPSRDLEGDLRVSNATLRYLYHDFALTLRARASRELRFYFDLEYRIREDDFVGYNSYVRPRIQLRSTYRRSKGMRLRFALRYDERDYDRGFIFDRPTDPRDGSSNPNKFYETTVFEASGEWPLRALGDRWFVFGDYEHRDQRSRDPRWGYVRSRVAAGLKWRL